jgi:hypothetical protein
MTRRKRRRWSQQVTETSRALDLEQGVFTFEDPRRVARSLARSARESRRRKAEPFRSAMSMLTFYMNRAGKQLAPAQRRRLEAAKDELRKIFAEPVPETKLRRKRAARLIAAEGARQTHA